MFFASLLSQATAYESEFKNFSKGDTTNLSRYLRTLKIETVKPRDKESQFGLGTVKIKKENSPPKWKNLVTN